MPIEENKSDIDSDAKDEGTEKSECAIKETLPSSDIKNEDSTDAYVDNFESKYFEQTYPEVEALKVLESIEKSIIENSAKDRTKKVTWEKTEAENTINEDKAVRLQSLKEDSFRPHNLDLNLNEKLKPVKKFLTDDSSSENDTPEAVDEGKSVKTGASWDIDFSAGNSGKPSKRLQALKQARTQCSGERYDPPKVMVSANQIAQRKVLDLKRW